MVISYSEYENSSLPGKYNKQDWVTLQKYDRVPQFTNMIIHIQSMQKQSNHWLLICKVYDISFLLYKKKKKIDYIMIIIFCLSQPWF